MSANKELSNDVFLADGETTESVTSNLVGGFSSPARSRPELGGRAFWVSRGQGAYLWDIQGNKYNDINAGHGAAQVGHAHPAIDQAIQEGIKMGLICGQETLLPGRVASRLCNLVPAAELVRFVFTGTKATDLAIRLARGHTGRSKIIKFEGHYHGHNDSLQFSMFPPLDKAGPRECPAVLSESIGLTPEAGKYVTILTWNDLDLLEKCLKKQGKETAAIIMEPINFNSGGLLPRPGYLEGVRKLTEEYGIVLIFDEILSGFRTGPDCAQGYFGVTPDLCTLGKAFAGGMPLAALAGKKEFMESLAPIGKVVDSGTYYGQVLVMHAAKAFLDIAADQAVWDKQKKLIGRFHKELDDLFKKHNAGRIQAVGNRFAMHFGLEEEIFEYRQWVKRDTNLERAFFTAAFNHGVYFMKSAHHGITWAHTDKDIDEALSGIDATLAEAKKSL